MHQLLNSKLILAFVVDWVLDVAVLAGGEGSELNLSYQFLVYTEDVDLSVGMLDEPNIAGKSFNTVFVCEGCGSLNVESFLLGESDASGVQQDLFVNRREVVSFLSVYPSLACNALEALGVNQVVLSNKM